MRRVPAADLTYEELLERGKPERADIFDIDENSIAELFYTSGSTGTPKGVMLCHRTLYLHALSVAGMFEDVETLVDLHTIPLFHANGWGRPQASTMLGVKQVMVRRFEPTFVFKLIQEHRATRHEPGSDHGQCAAQCVRILAQYDLSSMRHIMLGGAASSPELIERMEQAFHCDVFGGYGLTETAPVLTSARAKRVEYVTRRRALTPAGTPWRAGRFPACRSAWWIRK